MSAEASSLLPRPGVGMAIAFFEQLKKIANVRRMGVGGGVVLHVRVQGGCGHAIRVRPSSR
jgi:hypothetical protein